MESIGSNYLSSINKQFAYYKSLGDKSFLLLTGEQMHWQYNEVSNSIAVIIKHVAGNSISRWTNFLTSDGEKSFRNRDEEFEDSAQSKDALLQLWEDGWACLFNALSGLTENDLAQTVYIRNEAHTVIEAINRQLAHLPYHIGQIVFIAKMITADSWTSLTIPKGQSGRFNAKKFSEEKK